MNYLKTFKSLSVAFSLLLSVFNIAQEQNPDWTLPPNYSVNLTSGAQIPAPLPQPGGTYGYGGTYGNVGGSGYYSAHNCYRDGNNKPLFFIVDGNIYNRNGYLIASMQSAYSNITYFYYGKEICIVPDPSSCTRYYIFASPAVTFPSGYTCTHLSGADTREQTPIYTVIDISLPNPLAGTFGMPSTELGKNVTSGLTSPNTSLDLYTATSTPADTGSVLNNCMPYYGTVSYAATRVRSDGSRLLFVYNTEDIIIYQITTTGISYFKQYDLDDINTTFGSADTPKNPFQTGFGEMELYEDSANNVIKVAFDVIMNAGQLEGSVGLINFPYKLSSYPYEGPHQASTLYSGLIELGYNCSTSQSAYTMGIEFSPNGKYVYCVHNQLSACDTNVVEAFSYASYVTGPGGSGGPLGINLIPSTVKKSDFDSTQIELGTDTAMYLIGVSKTGSRRLARITSPSAPSSANFTDNYISLSNYPVIVSGVTQPVRFLPDQIDGDPYALSTSGYTCCINNTGYDQYKYTSGTGTGWTAATQTWTASSNPLSGTGTANIGDELRIAAGYSVTIENMTIKFTPQARLIVEGYNGTANAKLVLKKCTLDVDTRCQTRMWPGVRVWGDNTQSRTYTSQGYIYIDSMSVIQNAWIGVELGCNESVDSVFSYPVPVPSNPTTAGGGLIYANNSSFINNQKDIVFDTYTSGTGGICSVFGCTLTTNAYLIGGSSIPPLYHIQLTNYKPNVNMQADNFSCSTSLTASGYVYSCDGIYSSNSSATVDQNSGSVRSNFSNFLYGIYALNSGGNTNTLVIKHSNFKGNQVGTYLGNIVNATFNNDSLFIRNTTIFCTGNGCGTNFSGLFLDNSTGYQVQGNYFAQYTSGSKHPYGVVSNNSGAHVNCIFNNTFKNLYKGSQAQYRNFASYSSSPHNYVGLVYLCNTFSTSSISSADIYVPATGSSSNVGGAYTDTAAIQYNHGSGQTSGYPQTGGNTFSKTSGGSDFYIETTGKIYGVNYIYYCASGTCSGAANNPDNNITTNLTTAAYRTAEVNCTTNPYVNGLRISNPIQYMLSQAADFKITCDSIKNAMSFLSATDSTEKFNLTVKLGQAFSTRHRLMDEAIHLLIENQNDSSMNVVHSLMKEKALELPVRSQLETAIAINDSAMGVQALNQVANAEGQSNYVKLHTILLNNMRKTPEQIMSNSSNVSQILAMAKDSSDRSTYMKANALLQSIGLSNYQPYYQDGTKNNGDNNRTANVQNVIATSSSLISQPNPFKGSAVIKTSIIQKTQNAFVVVTDMLGNEITRYPVQQGDNEINFDATNINPQVLFCTLIIDGVKIKTNKMILIK